MMILSEIRAFGGGVVVVKMSNNKLMRERERERIEEDTSFMIFENEREL